MKAATCKICGLGTLPCAREIVLGKHEVQYYRCPDCGFVQTEEPFWLNEAYADPIARSDVGLLDRNIRNAGVSRSVISFLFHPKARFLDYGGGYGVFVRLMRDAGYDFYRHDRYCPNLFANGFDADVSPGARYELVTAFEVFEHFVDPLAELKKLLQWSPNILFSTLLLPPTNPQPKDWWYYSLEHGQHVALYTVRALSGMAGKAGLNLYTDGRSMHLLTSRKMPAGLFRLVASQRFSRLVIPITQRATLIQADADRHRRPSR